MKGRSSNSPTGRKMRPRPKMTRTTMPASRRRLSEKWSALSTTAPKSVAALKLITRPATTAYGRHDLTWSRRAGALLGAVITYFVGGLARVGAVAGVGVLTGASVGWRLTPAASTTGKTGRMHGEMLVIRPATNPIAIKTSIHTP